MLDDELTSPKDKGRYFSLPDYTSRLFDMSLASLTQALLDEMRDFEAKKLGINKRSLVEARQLTDFHNHPDVVQEWEDSDQEDEDYEGPEWFYGALASFVFSIKCLYGTYKFLKQYYPDFQPRRVIDWGGGLGMHSLISAYLWPDSKVYYYNVPGLQSDFAKDFVKKEYDPGNLFIKTKRESLPEQADLIICYEVLEHLREPVDGVRDILKVDPEVLSVSFSFTAPCRGHYAEFHTDEGLVPRNEIARYVNSEFRTKYEAIAHGWNARPVLWKKL